MSDLDDIKVGDIVFVTMNSIGMDVIKKTKVGRVTKTMVFCVGSFTKYSKRDGYCVIGNAFSSNYSRMQKYSHELEQKWQLQKKLLRNKKMLKEVSKIKPDDLTDEHYIVLKDILDHYISKATNELEH